MARTRATRRGRGRRSRRDNGQQSDNQYDDNLHQLDHLPQNLPTFTDDQQNPYHQAPQYVKEMFSVEQETIKFSAQKINQDYFKVNAKQVRYQDVCVNSIQDIGYVCYTCFPNDEYKQCQQCFETQKHKGHYYKPTYHQWSYNMYCNCGKGTNNAQLCCKKHSQSGEQKPIVLPNYQQIEQNQRTFVNYFLCHLKILIYLFRRSSRSHNFTQLIQNIKEHLTPLFQMCISKNQAIIPLGYLIVNEKVAMKPSQINHPVTILEYLLRMNYIEFVMPLCRNSQFCYKLIKLWSCPQNSNNKQIISRSKHSKCNMSNMSFLLQISNMISYLCKQNIVPGRKNQLISSRFISESYTYIDGKSALLYYLQALKANTKTKQEFIKKIMQFLQLKVYPQQVVRFIIKQIFEFMQKNFIQQKLPQQKKQAKQSKESDQESDGSDNESQLGQKQQKQQEQKSNIDLNKDSPQFTWKNNLKKKYIPQNFREIYQYLFFLVNANILKIGDVRNKMVQIGLSEKIFDQFMFASISARDQNSYLERNNDILFLFLTIGSPYQNRLITLFLNKYMQADTPIFRRLKSILNLIKQIAHSYSWGLTFFTHPEFNYQSELEQLLKEYLYSAKKLTFYELSNSRYQRNSLLSIPNSQKILEQMCEFIPDMSQPGEDLGECIYTSDKQYPNDLCLLESEGSQIFQSNSIKYNSQPDIQKYQSIKNILGKILSSQKIHSKLNKQIAQYMKNNEKDVIQQNRSKQRDIVMKYVYILVLTHHFGNYEKSEKLLEELRSDQKVRQKYQKFCDKQKLQTLLSILPQKVEKEGQMENSQKQKQRIQKLKEKAKLKKDKIKKKYKEKSNNVLGLHATKSLKEEQQQAELCLFCRQPQKIDNPLAYVASVNKNKTLSSALYGQANVSKISVSSCFHCVHLQCFPKLDRRNGHFTCLLCQKQRNTLIPKSYEPQNKKIFKICQNLLTANFVYNYDCLQVQSLFMILFKHLLESKSLNIFAYATRVGVQSFMKQKIDNFVQDFLSQILQKSSELQKQQYKQQIKELQKLIDQCQNKKLRLVQKIIFNALQADIIGLSCDITEQQARELADNLNPEDFEILEDELLKLGTDIPRLPNQVKKNNQLVSLVFQPLLPPNSHLDIPNIGSLECSQCKKKDKYSICMICSKTFCSDCNCDDQHDKAHGDRVLLYLVRDNQVRVKVNNRNQSDYMHLSLCRLPLSDISFKTNSHRDKYILQKHKLDRLMKIFFQQI